ncbi:hypothetical protein HRQ91_01485 [Treponema parvum]|uniref:Uncharacterized protein n=1 Tax=Treponema parvum TaxID=138851 RepID=A0A975IDS6_9SPIR|nr:hypothetical protein [Treponema parvum]QTQ13231.1 hypothetical protein HRQ91_01485 [Treponema parvum]
MKRIMLFFTVLFCGAYFTLFAQSAEKMTETISAKEITFSQAAYFAAAWRGLINDDASGKEALLQLEKEGIWSVTAAPEDTVNLKQFSALCLKAWNIKGGLLYSLTHSDRYAFRELQARKLLSRTDDPEKKVSGREALRIFMRCSEIAEGEGSL